MFGVYRPGFGSTVSDLPIAKETLLAVAVIVCFSWRLGGVETSPHWLGRAWSSSLVLSLTTVLLSLHLLRNILFPPPLRIPHGRPTSPVSSLWSYS